MSAYPRIRNGNQRQGKHPPGISTETLFFNETGENAGTVRRSGAPGAGIERFGGDAGIGAASPKVRR